MDSRFRRISSDSGRKIRLGGAFLHICGDIKVGDRPIVLALFLAGLGGSVTHCLTMCSTFVLAQSDALTHRSVLARLLLPYHAGRLITYGILGSTVAGTMGLAVNWSGFVILRHLMLAAVAMIFLSVFAGRLLSRFGIVLALPRLKFLGVFSQCAAASWYRLRNIQSAGRRFALGLSLGMLPCPLVFAALMAVATTGNPVIGGAGMMLFGLGTLPALLGLAFASSNILKRSPWLQDGLTLAALGVNGVLLLSLAVG